MAGAVGSLMAMLWTGGSSDPVDTDGLPRRYTTSTIVVGTVVAAALVGAVSAVRLVLGELTGSGLVTSPFWLLVALVVFLPVALAAAAGPPGRATGLALGIPAGLAAGALAGAGLAAATSSVQWSVLGGVTVAALVLAVVFGLCTRDRAGD